MTEILIEILDDAQADAVVANGDSFPTVEIQIQRDVTSHELTVQEFIELTEQGPTGDPGPVGPADVSGLAFVRHDGAYAPRNSVTTDPERVVVWIGPVAPAIDATYALDNVDVWWNTAG